MLKLLENKNRGMGTFIRKFGTKVLSKWELEAESHPLLFVSWSQTNNHSALVTPPVIVEAINENKIKNGKANI